VAEEMGIDPLAYSCLPRAEDLESSSQSGGEGRITGRVFALLSWTRRKERSPKKMTAGRYF